MGGFWGSFFHKDFFFEKTCMISWNFIEEQINLIKGLASKITTLEEKANSNASVSRLSTKISNLEEKLEHYGCREFLKNVEECESIVKIYIKNTLKNDVGESDYNRINRIGPKVTN